MPEGFPKLYALYKFLIYRRFFHSLTEKRRLSNNNNSLSSISNPRYRRAEPDRTHRWPDEVFRGT